MDVGEKRTPKREHTQMVPQPVNGEPGLVLVDTTWGIIQPIQIAEGQCPQSPSAIHNLLAAGYPPEKILYYRGGMHDWVTLGLPVVKGR